MALEPVTAETRATAIRIGNPASWKKAVRVLAATGGWCEQVNEREIALAKAEIGAEGIGCEPASAVTLAGLEEAGGRWPRRSRRDGCAAVDGAHAEGLGVHDPVPPRRAADGGRDGRSECGGVGAARAASQRAAGAGCGRGRCVARAGCCDYGDGVSGLRLKLPATSANLGPGFDAAGLAMSIHLTVEAQVAKVFAIHATGRDAELCGALESNLILDTYIAVLERAGVAVKPLALKLHNEIPLGMGCGSSAAALLAGVALADHFGELQMGDAGIVAEASRIEGHPDNVAACWYGGFTVSAKTVLRCR